MTPSFKRHHSGPFINAIYVSEGSQIPVPRLSETSMMISKVCWKRGLSQARKRRFRQEAARKKEASSASEE